jgi:glutamate transport system permease protein
MSVLYDAPGPQARRRSRIFSVIGVIAIATLVAWVIYTMAAPRTIANGAVLSGLFDPARLDILENPLVWAGVWRGLLATLQMAAVAAILALAVGVLFSFARTARSLWIRVPTAILLEFFRGMPVLLMMLFILLVAATGSYWAGVSALAVYNGAIIGEALRAGILSLPKGQREAGLSIGLTPVWTRLIIEFPQAFRQMLPILIAQLIVLLKDTSLAYIVGYSELLRTVTNMQNFFGNRYLFTLFTIVVVVYLSVNLLLSWLARTIARRTGSKSGPATGVGSVQGPLLPVATLPMAGKAGVGVR